MIFRQSALGVAEASTPPVDMAESPPHRTRDRPDTRVEIGQFLGIAVQLGLVLGVALIYRLELERGFGVVAALIFIGFLVHSWLPSRGRVAFFLFLSVVAVCVLLRGQGVWLFVIGLGLIGLCHVPVAWSVRVGLVSAAAAALAVMRAGWVGVSWADAVIPVVAAMFMFRLFLYLYDLKEDRTPATIWQRLSYFFLLPNVCFPLFPVVDYKTFLRTYYDAPAVEIYQKGVFWMLRGISHLLLYRLIYFLMPRAELDLQGILGVYVFMAMTHALYLGVSGLFHLIVGSLCLFGFNLPLTNNRYFLASSFNDLWRRINIYWKDFMMSTAFYPVFLGTRRWDMTIRLIVSTGFVFVVTWFLHSYQWFWLQGVFPVSATDVVFWGVLGAALAINSVWEAHKGRRRPAGPLEWSMKDAVGVTTRTIGVFSAMAVLWSLWNSASLGEWALRLLQARESGGADIAVFALLALSALSVGVLFHWLEAHRWGFSRIEAVIWRHASVIVPGTALLLIAVSQPIVHYRLGAYATALVIKAQSTRLNTIDVRRQERGYYEALSRATQFGAPMLTIGAPEWVGISDTPAAEMTLDIRGVKLKPNVEIDYQGAALSTNEWGLRDRDYEKNRPAGTYRIALLGPSTAMGKGVENDQTFENIVEDRLNRELTGGAYEHYEILNFAMEGYGALEALYLARGIVPDFEPQVVMYVIHPGEAYRMIDRLRLRLKLGARMKLEPSDQLGSDFAPVLRAIEKSDPGPSASPEEFERLMQPYEDEILAWTYREIVEASRQRSGAIPLFVLISLPDQDFDDDERAVLRRVIHEADGEAIELEHILDGQDPDALRIAEWDTHPNAEGHRLIADRLYTGLVERAEALGLLKDGNE